MATGTSRRYQLGSALAAFLIWGGWTYVINDNAAPALRVTSALVQGTASFTITLIMVQSVTWIYGRLPDNWSRLVLPGLITVTITGSCLALIHRLIGTPRVLPTIAPALTVAFLFCLYTAYKLHREALSEVTNHGR